MMKSGDYKEFYEIQRHVNYQKRGLNSDEDFRNTMAIIQNYLNEENVRLLDIGCGDGKYARKFKEYGYEVCAIDKFEPQVRRAKLMIDAQIADAVNLPFHSNIFDVCTMVMVIHLLSHEERRRAFREVYRVLKPGGLLVIKTCSHEDLDDRFTSRFFPEIRKNDYKRYPDSEQLSKELSCFKMIKVKRVSQSNRYTKDELMGIYCSRQSSNMWLLDDEALNRGIKRFDECYPNNEQDIIKETYNTFFTYAKE